MDRAYYNCACRRLQPIWDPALTRWLWPSISIWRLKPQPAAQFSIVATGRDADRCARLDDNLILETYKELLQANGRPIVPLSMRMNNGIPLGMGCGSSAAGRLAAIALAVHFGGLAWNSDRILEEAYALEGHPDNVAACWLGGFVAAGLRGQHGPRGAE